VYSAIVVAVLGFLFTLYLNSGDFFTKFENYLLFISYWIAPWAAVVLADWWLRRGRADVTRLTNFAGLPSGWQALASLLVGFLASLPFQTSVFGDEVGKATGLPVNTIAANTLHFADIAYIVGFVVSFVVYWALGRSTMTSEMSEGSMAAESMPASDGSM
jgi:NCS1 family nucleobase:cation symporter-1